MQSLGDGLLIGSGVAAVGAIIAWTLVSPTIGSTATSPAPVQGEVAAPPPESAREVVGA